MNTSPEHELNNNGGSDDNDVEYKKSMTSSKPTVKDNNTNTPPKNTIDTNMKDRYSKAWKVMYDKQAQWRKDEIDESMKHKLFGNKRWDTEFINEVIKLAESEQIL